MQNFYSSTNLIGSGGLNADDIKMLKDSTNCVVDSSKKIFGRAHQGQKVDTCLNGPGLVDNINAEDAGCLFGIRSSLRIAAPSAPAPCASGGAAHQPGTRW